MKIIKQGKTEEELKAVLNKTKRFECKTCGCVFEADKSEYVEDEHGTTYCMCPNCIKNALFVIRDLRHELSKIFRKEADAGVMLEQLVQALSFEEKAGYIKMQHFKNLRQKERISGEEWKPDDLVEQAFRHSFEEGKKNANT